MKLYINYMHFIEDNTFCKIQDNIRKQESQTHAPRIDNEHFPT